MYVGDALRAVSAQVGDWQHQIVLRLLRTPNRIELRGTGI